MAFSPLPTNMEQAKADILSWREMHKEQAAEIERLRKDAAAYHAIMAELDMQMKASK